MRWSYLLLLLGALACATRPPLEPRLAPAGAEGSSTPTIARADADGDGIADERDECPDEPEDIDLFMDEDGCPEEDADADRIADADDQCPLAPEKYNGFEDDDGCPDEIPKSLVSLSSQAVVPLRPSTEEYAHIAENDFVRVDDDPRSTFSIDVDTASYSNMRRFLLDGNVPPSSAIRVEELINYFDYEYPAPTGKHPFSVTTEVADCPWNLGHRLVHVGLRGRAIESGKMPPRNLVFLLDVSGSMATPDKLPLLVRAMRLLVDQLGPRDTVAIVVYAGAAGLVLPPTQGSKETEILAALDRLEAGGSTAGAEGIQLAYAVAEQNFHERGVNRVILATDGDFNVGPSSEGELVRLIEEQRRGGVSLSVLGFGTGNIKDDKMEQLADKGNGNYAYIDTIHEARKVLVQQAGGTLVTIAKDVKIQVEFNPAEVSEFRLVGYENRTLDHADFNDDRKDAGEIGAEHTVTALYEVVPARRARKGSRKTDPLKYQQSRKPTKAARSGELMTLKLRYKPPRGTKSKLVAKAVRDHGTALAQASTDFRFSAAVAMHGMLLRGSEHRGTATFDAAFDLARGAQGSDRFGHRAEFVSLVRKAQSMATVP